MPKAALRPISKLVSWIEARQAASRNTRPFHITEESSVIPALEGSQTLGV